MEGAYCAGAPELAAEITLSTASHHMGPKLELYRKAGVREYLAVMLGEQRVAWHLLTEGRYDLTAPDEDGLLRSRIFPGLWLDSAALFRLERPRVMDALARGLKSPEHEDFVRLLASRK